MCYYRSLIPVIILVSTTAFAKVQLNYVVTPNSEADNVHVKVELTGLQPHTVPTIAIQESYASVDDYYNEIENLTITNPKNRKLIPHTNNGELVPYMWDINKPISGTEITYEYTMRVIQKIPESTARFKPSMDTNSYYSNGFPLFIYPDHYNSTSAKIDIDSINVDFRLPSNWQAITSFQNMNGDFAPKNLDELLYSSISLGLYRRIERSLPNDANFVLSIIGDWKFTDEELANAATKIISSQIETMQSWTPDVYTVTLSQHEKVGSKSGSGLTNAFEMFASTEAELDEFYFLLSHENFHYWNGHRILYDHARNRWFSEGFTNYYTFLFISRPKLWDTNKVLTEFSSTYQDYFHSPISTSITFDDAARYFWDYQEYSKHFYHKGMLMALMADVRLRALSNNQKSLDDFMKHLDQKLNGSGINLDNELFLQEINTYSESDWQDYMTTNVFGTDWLDVNSIIQEGGMRLVNEDCQRPFLGVTIIPNICNDGRACGYKATEVVSDSPAYRAGIRENDIIVKKEVKRQPGAIATLVVSTPEGEQEYKFKTEVQTLQCKNLIFTNNPTPLQHEIRSSIWGQQED